MLNPLRAGKMFWNRSIQRQLMLGVALVHAILMTIFVTDLVTRQKRFLKTQSIEQTEALARSLSANSVSWVLANDVAGLEEVVHAQKNYPHILYAMILSTRGEVLAHTDSSLAGLYVQDPISLSLLKSAPVIQWLVNDANLLDIAAPIFSQKKHIGWSRVAVSQATLHQGLQKILLDGIGYTLMAIAVGSLFAVAMARGVTNGIRNLLRVTTRVTSGEIDTHVESDRVDELGQLGLSFNKMIERIQTSIKDLEQAQQVAVEEKEKAEAYLNTAMVAFLVLDPDERILSANPHCLKIIEYEEKEIIGQQFSLIRRPSDSSEERFRPSDCGYPPSVVTDTPFETDLLSKNGEIRIMEWRSTPLYDPHKNWVGMLLSGIDITEKKKNEAELERHREHLEELVEIRTSALQEAMENIKTLKGIIPICASCKKIRDDQGYWNQLESYVAEHSEADFSHSICPECIKRLYPDLSLHQGEP